MMMKGLLPHDPAKLAAMPQLTRAADPNFGALDRSAVQFQPRMFSNDQIGDCTAAGFFNACLGLGALHGYEPAIVDSKAPDFYADVIGEPGATIAQLVNSNGAVLLDVLRFAARNGVDIGLQVPVSISHAVIDPQNRALIADTIRNTGVVIIGITLYEQDDDDFLNNPGAPWDMPAGNVVGGHCVGLWDFTGPQNTDTVRMITWGALQPITWRGLAARLNEVHAVAMPAPLAPPLVNWTAVDLAQLADGTTLPWET